MLVYILSALALASEPPHVKLDTASASEKAELVLTGTVEEVSWGELWSVGLGTSYVGRVRLNVTQALKGEVTSGVVDILVTDGTFLPLAAGANVLVFGQPFAQPMRTGPLVEPHASQEFAPGLVWSDLPPSTDVLSLLTGGSLLGEHEGMLRATVETAPVVCTSGLVEDASVAGVEPTATVAQCLASIALPAMASGTAMAGVPLAAPPALRATQQDLRLAWEELDLPQATEAIRQSKLREWGIRARELGLYSHERSEGTRRIEDEMKQLYDELADAGPHTTAREVVTATRVLRYVLQARKQPVHEELDTLEILAVVTLRAAVRDMGVVQPLLEIGRRQGQHYAASSDPHVRAAAEGLLAAVAGSQPDAPAD